MSEDTKKAPEQKFGDEVQEATNNFIKSDYIIKSHDLIQQGFAVYLLSQGTNTPYKGSRGHLDATKDVKVLTDMFLKYGANSNVGIILKDTGLVVLDIDRHTQNKNGLTSLKKAGITPNFDNEVIEKTPRNGFHVFYYIPKGFDIDKINHNPFPGVEIITDKITVAPSIKLVDGGGIGYQHFGKDFIHANLMPDWLIELVSNVATSGNTKTGRVPRYSTQERWEMVLNGFVQGQRNNMCVSLSGYLLRINIDPNIAYAIVKKVNENSDVPLADKEVETIYRSAYQREKQRRLGGR
ncbi:bifunctional DNA primase/polymerase [Leuconostoc mesenteroides]|uniref:bifunctional DNA primase/polymerase n=1 Tax=Leuconostoc mesenteroides TaxID=1245 RepID=UPI00235F8EDF|nr:bifunctional DNA primase/polymerase [Leuconostoc mesenteroides]